MQSVSIIHICMYNVDIVSPNYETPPFSEQYQGVNILLQHPTLLGSRRLYLLQYCPILRLCQIIDVG